jgi:hypothetical protein
MKCKLLLLLPFMLAACGRQDPAPAEPRAPAPAAQPTTATAGAVQATQSAQEFWSKFRAAALAEDHAALASMARVPFMTRGETDDDPTVTHEAAELTQLLPGILAQDTGLAAEPEPVRAYLERHAEVPQVALGGGQFAPVSDDATRFSAGPLGFEKIDGRWYWVSAYLAQ